jgi:hypothetical protein
MTTISPNRVHVRTCMSARQHKSTQRTIGQSEDRNGRDMRPRWRLNHTHAREPPQRVGQSGLRTQACCYGSRGAIERAAQNERKWHQLVEGSQTKRSGAISAPRLINLRTEVSACSQGNSAAPVSPYGVLGQLAPRELAASSCSAGFDTSRQAKWLASAGYHWNQPLDWPFEGP